MKSLSNYSKLAVALVLVGLASMTGCKPDLVDPVGQNNPLQFAALRIVNYTTSDVANENCTVPVDVYFQPSSKAQDTLANVNNLAFGGVSPYATSLEASQGGTVYDIDVHPVRSRDKHLLRDQITLLPGHRYSYVVYTDPANPGNFAGKFVEDGAPTPPGDPKKVTFVRFMNVNPGSPLTATVNGINGEALARDLNYRDVGPYLALNTALDSSYAFYVFNSDRPDSIFGKITYQSFAPGSYHTIVYAGDLCRTAPHNQLGNPLDSLRVRVLDDNVLGIEETNPVPSSIRYFIVNAMIPDQADPNAGLNQLWAYTVSNDANPNHHGFTFDPVPTFSAVPGYGAVNDGIQDAYLSSTVFSAWIQVKGFTVDNPNGDNPKLVLDVHARRVGVQAENSYAILFYDTIAAPGEKRDSSAFGRWMSTVNVTEERNNSSVKLIFVNATAPSSYYTATRNFAGNVSSFYVNGDKVGMSGTPGLSANFDYAPGDLTIDAKLGAQNIPVIDAGSFTIHGAKGGEAYLVVLMGQRSDDNFHSNYPSRIKVFRIPS